MLTSTIAIEITELMICGTDCETIWRSVSMSLVYRLITSPRELVSK